MFFFDISSGLMNTIGLSLTYAGFGGLLVLLIKNETRLAGSKNLITRNMVKYLRAVGIYSYSIYLWHLAVMIYLAQPLRPYLDDWICFAIYLIGSIGMGWLSSIAIEKPILRYRNVKYPQLV